MMHGWGMGGLGMGLPFFGVIPLVLITGGIYLFVRWAGRGYGPDRGGSPARGGGRTARRGAPSTQELFRLARRNGGILTVSIVVSELGVDLPDAEALLDGVTDGTHVDMQVDEDGIVRYVFREFLR